MSNFKEQLDSLLNLSQDICNALDEDDIALATEFDRKRQAVIEFYYLIQRQKVNLIKMLLMKLLI